MGFARRAFPAVLAGLALSCGGVPPPPPSPIRQPPAPALDAGAPRALPTILRRKPRPAPVPPHVARCLAAEGVRAVIELSRATPDCSGVGHVQMVFEVHEARGASTTLRTAHGSQPLHAAFVSPRRPGALFVAALHLDRRPARRVFCVTLPPTDATVTCAHPVADLAEGRRILDATIGSRR